MDISKFAIDSWFIENLIATYITIFFWVISLIFSFKIWDKANKYKLSIKDILDNKYIDLNYFKYIRKYIFFILIIVLLHSWKNIFWEKYSVFIESFVLVSIFSLVYITFKNIINYLDLLNNSIETLFVDKYKKTLFKYLNKVLEKDYNNFSKKFIFKDINYVNSDHWNNLEFINFVNILKKIIHDDNDSILFINILNNFKNNENKNQLEYYQFLLLLLGYDWIEKDIKYWILSDIYIPNLNDNIKYDVNSLFDILIFEEDYLLYKFKNNSHFYQNNNCNLFQKYFSKYWFSNYHKLKHNVQESINKYIDYSLKNWHIDHYHFFNLLWFVKEIINKWEDTDIFTSNIQINLIKDYFLKFLKDNKKYILSDYYYKEWFFNDFVYPILDSINTNERSLINFIKFIIITIDNEEYHKEVLLIISKYVKYNDNNKHLAVYLKWFWDFSWKYNYFYDKELDIYNEIIKKYYSNFISDNFKNF